MAAKLLVLALTIAIIPVSARQPVPPSDPVEPIDAIVGALRRHPVVALGEVHGNEQSHAFRLALVRDKRFTDVANDIVVEFGNAKFQDLVDRFVAGGEVADEELRQVWQDTTQLSGVWDRPIYGEFFRAVRDINRSLEADRRLRVLLADPPVDWDLVRRVHEGPAREREGKIQVNGIWVDKARASALDRDGHAADVIRREVLAKGRRALLIFGEMHVRRLGRSVVARLEDSTTANVCTIVNAVGPTYDTLMTARPDITSWPVPSLVLDPRIQYDAVLYLGSPTAMTTSQLPASFCSDATYLKMRRERMGWAGMPDSKAEELLARDCGQRDLGADGIHDF